MPKPLVTAIVATYNRADIVEQAIESILGQTYKTIEVVIVDDGSTDDTQDVLRRYGSRVRVIPQPNAGPAAARNRGIAEAKGEIISFLDSDDLWLPEKIERQVALLERAGKSVPCCVCNAVLKSKDKPSSTSFQRSLLTPSQEAGLWLNATQLLLHRFMLFNQVAAVRRVALEKVGGFDATLRLMEDYDLALRLSLLGPFAFIREPLVIYNMGSAGSLADEALQKATYLKECVVKIRERMNETVKTSANLRAPARLALQKARWELWVTRLQQRRVPGAMLIGRLLQQAWYYCGAIADRTPLFEKMNVSLVPETAASESISCRGVGVQDIER